MGKAFHVYILRCADGSLYVGSTANLRERLKAHNEGKAAAYTALRRPVRVVYSEPHESELTALRRERQIKGWARAKKEALIRADRPVLIELSRSRN